MAYSGCRRRHRPLNLRRPRSGSIAPGDGDDGQAQASIPAPRQAGEADRLARRARQAQGRRQARARRRPDPRGAAPDDAGAGLRRQVLQPAAPGQARHLRPHRRPGGDHHGLGDGPRPGARLGGAAVPRAPGDPAPGGAAGPGGAAATGASRRRPSPRRRQRGADPGLAGGSDPPRRRARLGAQAQGQGRGGGGLLRRRRLVRRRLPRVLQHGRRGQGAGHLPVAEQRLGDLDPARDSERRPGPRVAGAGLRLPRRLGRRQRPRGDVRGDRASGGAGAGRRGADVDRGPHLPHGGPYHRRRPHALRRFRRARALGQARPHRSGAEVPGG